jgi:hypothetical protein
MTKILWVTHPRHLPPAPPGKVVVVDVAFASGKQFNKKTKVLIDALGDRLIKWIDHHEHPTVWPLFAEDPRFLLVSNNIAHACPELITAEIVEDEHASHGAADVVMAHCDFDGALSAVKWMAGGKEPWPGADEDARFVDSPGRGHTITEKGQRISRAMGQAAQAYSRKDRLDFMTRATDSILEDEESLGLMEEIDTLAKKAADAEVEAKELADANGTEEAKDVFVIRTRDPLDNHMRRNLLIEAENRATLGVIYEPDREGGAWLTVATFSESLNLAHVPFLDGGRTDYRYARAHRGGHDQIKVLEKFLTGADVSEHRK